MLGNAVHIAKIATATCRKSTSTSQASTCTLCEFSLMIRPDCLSSLAAKGYVIIPRMYPNVSTTEIGSLLGRILDIEAQYPRLGVTTVQVLRPHHQYDAKPRQYSGTYGLDEFPLHTDLAHWANPPRYILLRCHRGSSSVATHLLQCSSIESALGVTTLRQALARPITPGLDLTLSLLSVRLNLGVDWGIRWDPLFLTPMNAAGERVARVMNTPNWKPPSLTSVTLAERGDTVIIDNLRCLHGRASVPVKDMSRQIERIYLSEMYQ